MTTSATSYYDKLLRYRPIHPLLSQDFQQFIILLHQLQQRAKLKMGIFKHKDKARPDLLNPAPNINPTSNPATSQTPAPTTNNSFNDSTYYSSSNVSSADTQRLSNNKQQRAQGQRPGTTVTTTTTTTTSKCLNCSSF